MSRSSPFKQATAQHKYQFDFLLAKLELILANPLAKVSVILTVGPQKIESTQRPKASKETFLKETLSILVNLYEEPKKQAYQEKTATLEVFLNNSKVSNLIGVLKLDLANYVNSTGEKLESMVLQKSPEYQGKILFGVNASRIEELQEEEIRSNAQNSKNFNNLEPNDSVSQRDMSDAGGVKNGQKRSVTPNLRPIKTPGSIFFLLFYFLFYFCNIFFFKC